MTMNNTSNQNMPHVSCFILIARGK